MGTPRAPLLQAGQVVGDLPRRPDVSPRAAGAAHRHLNSASSFTVAAFNAHWGIGRAGPYRARRFDVAALVRGFDADVVVVPEAFRFPDGANVLDPLTDDGWFVQTTHLAYLAERSWGHGDVRPAGGWELAVCTRLPAGDWRELPMGHVFHDHADVRNAIACTVQVGDALVDVVGLHTSSKLWYAGPITHMRNLAPQLPRNERPAVLAGDFNFWGPGVLRILPGWKRAVLGRTFPAHRPHSQIDHILVNDHVEILGGEVLPACGSDHRPVRARLVVH